MASGANRVYRGSFLGTGAAIDVRVAGFRPRAVRLVNITGITTAVWIEGMADGTGMKEITDGTKSLMTNGITPLSDGFRLGTDADLNTSGERIFFEATD